MKRFNNKPADMRSFTCPQCDKQRMTRMPDHEVSQEKQSYKTRDGSAIDLFTDICEFCKQRNSRKYFEPSKRDLRRVINAIQSEAKVDEDESLEDLL